MSTDKSFDKNQIHMLRSNVKVKTEPGTSPPVSIARIKTEPGLPTTASGTTTTRLTSFRLPRDLTLGGSIKTEKPKKVYTPNLNAQRNKKKDDTATVKNDSPRGGRDRERGGRGRANDRGRGRGSSNLVQSTGVFSEGIMEMPYRGRRGGGAGTGSRSGESKDAKHVLERPKLDLDRVIDKAEEEEKLKLLLRDDFIDDGTDLGFDNAPIMLPMIEDVKLYKEEPKMDPCISDEEFEQKPIILENGKAMKPNKKEKAITVSTTVPSKEKKLSTIPQIIENKLNSYILIQFPDCLPGLESSNDTTNEPRAKRTSEATKEKENDKNNEYCTLNTLKGGILGKLEILRSGKARLRVGENNLVVDVGSTLSFRQDLIAAKLNTTELTGELVNLGPVSSTLVCSPDWESMLARL